MLVFCCVSSYKVAEGGKCPSLGNCHAAPQPVCLAGSEMPTTSLWTHPPLGLQHIILPQPYYQAGECRRYSILVSSTVNSSKSQKIKISVLLRHVKISGLRSQPHSRRVTGAESWHGRMVNQALPLVFRLFTQNSPWERCYASSRCHIQPV